MIYLEYTTHSFFPFFSQLCIKFVLKSITAKLNEFYWLANTLHFIPIKYVI